MRFFKSNKSVRLYFLLPASLFMGLLLSEISKGLPTQSSGIPSTRSSKSDQTSAEWLAGRSAAMAVSNSPLVERTR